MPYYLNPIRAGLDQVASQGNGTSIFIKWYQAYPSITTNKIAYHIYYSTNQDNVFTEGVKYVSIDGSLEANLIGLIPGQDYYLSIRPVEYNSTQYNLSLLPTAYDNLKFYPTSILRSNITSTSLSIPLMDVADFPSTGIIKIGIELINYVSVDSIGNNLILDGYSRGYGTTYPRIHNTDGYDGYNYWDPIITLFTYFESNMSDRVFVCQSRFEYPNYQMTLTDGYHQKTKDLLTSDLTVSDNANIGFPAYDFAGYHKTDPVQLVDGTCIGSYIGGENGCIDEYGNVNVYRGFNLQEQSEQRLEVALSVTGRPIVLIQKMRTGITCSCFQPSSEFPDDRCPKCHGQGFVLSWKQYFNPRRSDGRLMARPGPASENVKLGEAGMESDFPLDLWTLTVPTIKNRDIVVLFDQADNEEFRYEVMDVTRNNTVLSQMGGQKFRVVRIRKTDPAYQIRIFRNTEKFPEKLNTQIGMTSVIPPHTHQIVINEGNISLMSQTTSVSQGHNHQVVFTNGQLKVLEVLSHTHTIILP